MNLFLYSYLHFFFLFSFLDGVLMVFVCFLNHFSYYEFLSFFSVSFVVVLLQVPFHVFVHVHFHWKYTIMVFLSKSKPFLCSEREMYWNFRVFFSSSFRVSLRNVRFGRKENKCCHLTVTVLQNTLYINIWLCVSLILIRWIEVKSKEEEELNIFAHLTLLHTHFGIRQSER